MATHPAFPNFPAMPNHLKALLVILPLAALVFAYAQRSCLGLMAREDFVRRRNIWFGLTLLAFLAHSFWLYAAIAALILIHASARESNRVALFFLVLMLIPPTEALLPGLGLINYFFSLTHVRLLALVILLPAYLGLRQRSDTPAFGRFATDKILAAYLLLSLALLLRETTVTDILRNAFYLFTDIFLPYYVISRSLRHLSQFREAMMSFVLAAMILAVVCAFEAARHWHLYRALADALGVPMDSLSMIERSGVLRAMGTSGHPIAAGYIMTVAMAFFLYLKDFMPLPASRRMGFAVLAAGLVAPLSRGPWVGTSAMFAVFLGAGPQALRRVFVAIIVGIMAISLLAVIPGGQRVLDLLPFIGSVERGSIDYRQQMLEATYAVMLRNPLFGSVNFAAAPELQAMIQGQGMIDIVNTYLLIGLRSGVVGLALFIGFFVFLVWGLFSALRRLPPEAEENRLLGRTLMAALIGILVTIFTVSSVGLIPVIYWSVAGLGVAYTRMIREEY